jgi:DNA-binding ferritin-like protein
MSMMSKTTLLYGSEESSDAGGASQFVSRLMHSANAIHMHHLMVEGPGSFAQHMALGVYDDLREAVDKLAEDYMGCTGNKLKFIAGAFELAPTPIAEIQKAYDYVEQSRNLMGNESHIQNDIDEICTLLATTLYKLTRLA